MYIIYVYIYIYMMAGTQNKEKTYSNYAVWNNVPFVISYRSFLLALRVFLVIPQIQVLQSSPEFYIEAMSFFIVCRMGTTHPTKITGGLRIMQGAKKQCRQKSSPRRIGIIGGVL